MSTALKGQDAETVVWIDGINIFKVMHQIQWNVCDSDKCVCATYKHISKPFTEGTSHIGKKHWYRGKCSIFLSCHHLTVVCPTKLKLVYIMMLKGLRWLFWHDNRSDREKIPHAVWRTPTDGLKIPPHSTHRSAEGRMRAIKMLTKHHETNINLWHLELQSVCAYSVKSGDNALQILTPPRTTEQQRHIVGNSACALIIKLIPFMVQSSETSKCVNL